MGFVPGCPQDPIPAKGTMAPIAVVLHRTYGGWAGDYSVIKNGALCQVLIGKEFGQWVQFMPTEGVAYHCNGANFRAFGVELTGVNEDPLTPWQEARLADVLAYAHREHGIPLDYLDPDSVPQASVWVNGGTFRGVISHDSVRTDDGSSQHSDKVTVADYAAAVGGSTSGEFTMTQMDTLAQWENDTRTTILDKVGQWMQEQSALVVKAVNDHIDKRLADLPAGSGGGLSEEQVRAIVREELDRTKLTA